jgi:hypothetical protein
MNLAVSIALAYVAAGLLIYLVAATMPLRPSFRYWAIFMSVRFALIQGVVLLLFDLDFSDSSLLVGSLAVVLALYFARLRKSTSRLSSSPGCTIVLLMPLSVALLSGLSVLTSSLASVSDWLWQESSVLFTLFLALAPGVYHWCILEHFYYQTDIQQRLECDLGFESGTNTMQGQWPGGEKYLYFKSLRPGGLMEQAGIGPDDIVVDLGGLGEFWARLEAARGGEAIPLTVASGSDPGLESKRPTRKVMVRIPTRNG